MMRDLSLQILATASATLAVLLVGVSPALPQSGADPALFVTSPEPGLPTFGEVLFSVEPSPAPPGATVEFLLDGTSVGTASEAPWEIELDVGQENRARRYEARLTLPDGRSATAVLVTPAITVNDEVSAELQQLYVTVSRSGDGRVLDLAQDDFLIFDDGDRQEIVTFARGDVRLTALLLIDSSASMVGDRLRNALRGARSFVERMRDIDDAAVALFSDRLLVRTPFSNDPVELSAELEGVEASGGTSLNDHLYLALTELEKRQGRRVVILLSDGVDSHSALRTSELRWLSRRSRALIYWIRTGDPEEARKSRSSAWKNPDAYRRELDGLEEIVQESGGRVILLENLADADSAFGEVMLELREQYVLGYYPTLALNNGRWHRTNVRVRGGYRVRSQAGYVDD